MKHDPKFNTAWQRTVNAVILGGAHTATAIIDPTHTVRVTRRAFKGRFPAKNQPLELVVTIGRPNYRTRQFIKLAQQAGEPFPIKKLRLTYLKRRAR